MKTAKVAISMDARVLARLDRLVERGMFPSRSQAIQLAVERELQHRDRGRLARECAKLDAAEEQALADEWIAEDVASWPEY